MSSSSSTGTGHIRQPITRSDSISRSRSFTIPVSQNYEDNMDSASDVSMDSDVEFLLNGGDIKQRRASRRSSVDSVSKKGSNLRERLLETVLVVVLVYLVYHWWSADGAGSQGIGDVSLRQSREPDELLPPETDFNCSHEDPFFLCPFQIKEGEHVSSPPHRGRASCWNTTESEAPEDHEFCHRYIRANHKMGHILTEELFGPNGMYRFPGEDFQRKDGALFDERGVPDLARYFQRNDYREVFITRNWIDSLISGYLYHKTGRECHLTLYGEPRKYRDDQVTNPKNFKKLLLLPQDYPAVEERYLCTYLAEESEEHGLRVYAEWAIRFYYESTLLVFKAVQEREDPLHRKTMFLCYERMNNPETREAAIHKIKEWFYPGGLPHEIPPIPQEAYSGGHSTSHDPELRAHLRRILEELDGKYFHNSIRRHSEAFGCEETD